MKTTYASIALILIAAGAFWLWNSRGDNGANGPQNGAPTDWVSSDTTVGSFSYPEDIGMAYVRTVDWPPLLNLEVGSPFSCTEAGAETARAGRTERVVVDGAEYCRTIILEGAAGSTYGQYAYAFEESDRVAILTFTLRFPQCMNYDDPEQSACVAEQEAFEPDTLVHRIAETVRLN